MQSLFHQSSTRHNLSTYGRQAFAIDGPDAWNSLSDDLRDPALNTDSFRRLLKIHLFSEYKYIHRITGITYYALYKSMTDLLIINLNAFML